MQQIGDEIWQKKALTAPIIAIILADVETAERQEHLIMSSSHRLTRL